MSLQDTINTIEEEYKTLKESCSNKYKEALINELTDLGVWGVDVYNKRTGKRGVLDLTRSSYGGISWEVVFIPYKKDGTLSAKYELIYIFMCQDFSERLMETITNEKGEKYGSTFRTSV